jgi:hypothetical protein
MLTQIINCIVFSTTKWQLNSAQGNALGIIEEHQIRPAGAGKY